MAEFDVSPVADKKNGFGVGPVYWKDDRGIDHYATVDAYEEGLPPGEIVILQGFMLSLVCGVRDAKQLMEMNPRALRFDLVGETKDSGALGDELVFEVEEYSYTEAYRNTYIKYVTHYTYEHLVFSCRSSTEAVR